MKRAPQLLIGWFGALALVLASCQSSNDLPPAAATSGAAGALGAQTAGAGGGALSGASGGVSTGRAGAAGSGADAGLADSAGAAGAAGSAGGANQACDAASVNELEVSLQSNWDRLGYPPYAFDGCTLVYVAAGSDPGALHMRHLATGKDTVLDSAASKPRRPAVSGSVITWEADGALGSEVRVRFDGKVQALSGAFVRAEEPRATNDAVVFTAFLGPGPNDDSDVYLFDVRTGQLSVVADGPGQQRFADVSPSHVAFTDFSEDPQGYFNEAGSISDIAVVERATAMRSNRAAPGKQAFPLLGTQGVFAYLEWAAVHPEPKFGQFWLKAGYLNRPISEDFNVKTTGQVSTNPAYVRPSLRGLNLDFVDQGTKGAALYRAALSAPGALVSLNIAGALQLLGPVAGDRFTLLADQRSLQSVSLLAIAR
ncbi:MAG TPA: hypothetical protein VJV79_34625 [Polyangiaceae bacterium]|nr:hypothetical protein [Polyangiaceae bacterium]